MEEYRCLEGILSGQSRQVPSRLGGTLHTKVRTNPRNDSKVPSVTDVPTTGGRN